MCDVDTFLQNLIRRKPKPYTRENLSEAILQQVNATEIVIKTYGKGRRTLGFHMPAEDMPFQQAYGGTPRMPIIVAPVSPAGEPINIGPARHIPCLSYLWDCVWPFFTSMKRAEEFFTVLENSEFQIPRYILLSFPWEPVKTEWQKGETAFAVNPIPEVFLAAVIPLLDEENDQLIGILPKEV